MVDIYNGLSQEMVDAQSACQFQRLLTDVARDRCALGVESWASSFSARSGPDLDGPILTEDVAVDCLSVQRVIQTNKNINLYFPFAKKTKKKT